MPTSCTDWSIFSVYLLAATHQYQLSRRMISAHQSCFHSFFLFPILQSLFYNCPMPWQKTLRFSFSVAVLSLPTNSFFKSSFLVLTFTFTNWTVSILTLSLMFPFLFSYLQLIFPFLPPHLISGFSYSQFCLYML